SSPAKLYQTVITSAAHRTADMKKSFGRGKNETNIRLSSLSWKGGGIRNSQLSCIGERERRHPPRVLVQDQRSRDRRLGALAAVFAFAKPAIDADRRALGFFKIHAGGVDQLCGVADFAPQTDGKARLGLRMRRHRTAHH